MTLIEKIQLGLILWDVYYSNYYNKNDNAYTVNTFPALSHWTSDEQHVPFTPFAIKVLLNLLLIKFIQQQSFWHPRADSTIINITDKLKSFISKGVNKQTESCLWWQSCILWRWSLLSCRGSRQDITNGHDNCGEKWQTRIQNRLPEDLSPWIFQAEESLERISIKNPIDYLFHHWYELSRSGFCHTLRGWTPT